MENKKGSGIFLGVVSIATLIVAIIGATFAYFSIAVSGGNGDVNVTAYEGFDVDVEIIRIHPLDSVLNDTERTVGNGIIPLAVSNLDKALDNDCLDERGYMVCALYQATFTNNGSEAVTFDVEVKTTSNTAAGEGSSPFTDLTFQSLTSNAGGYGTQGTATKLPQTTSTTGTRVADASHTATPGTSTHYFVVYLDEPTTATDQSSQMGASYLGQVIYTTVAGQEKLSGYFNA